MQTFREIERHLGLVPSSLVVSLSHISARRGSEEVFRRQHPQMLDSLVEVAQIQSTEASNAIENITASPERLVALVRGKAAPQNRSEQEIAGYKKVLETIHSNGNQIPFNRSIVLQFHRDLYSLTNQPGGRFKNVPNAVAKYDQSGSKIGVVFEGTSPFETPMAVDELHDRFDDALRQDRYPQLLLVGSYVFDFLMIHPFNDGNGRMSRLLTLLLLYRTGYDVGRFISLEKIVADTKETYYESLQKSTVGWDKGEHNIWPWLDYFLGTMNAAYKEFESRVGELTAGRGSKSQRVIQFIRSRASDAFTFDELERALPDISAVHIRKQLRQLRDDGVIESPGRGRKQWKRLRSDF